ncbi:hypothetical protein WDU94_005925 [Cyamophila willieti]
MKKHIRTHNGDKPYKCTHCSYSASRRDTLDHHIQVAHLLKKKFHCPMCSYKCSKKYNLQMHTITKHNVDLKGSDITDQDDLISNVDPLSPSPKREKRPMVYITSEILTPDLQESDEDDTTYL